MQMSVPISSFIFPCSVASCVNLCGSCDLSPQQKMYEEAKSLLKKGQKEMAYQIFCKLANSGHIKAIFRKWTICKGNLSPELMGQLIWAETSPKIAYALGVEYKKQRKEQAARYYIENSAVSGFPLACLVFGGMFQKGDCVPKCDDMAMKYYKRYSELMSLKEEKKEGKEQIINLVKNILRVYESKEE
jgi:hypothetical protein